MKPERYICPRAGFQLPPAQGRASMRRRVLGFAVSLMGYARARSRPNARGLSG